MNGVLDWINGVRAEYGQPPLGAIPRGDLGTGKSCPLANALADCGEHVYVGVGWYAIDGPSMLLPDGIAVFVRDVDAGRFPELAC